MTRKMRMSAEKEVVKGYSFVNSMSVSNMLPSGVHKRDSPRLGIHSHTEVICLTKAGILAVFLLIKTQTSTQGFHFITRCPIICMKTLNYSLSV